MDTDGAEVASFQEEGQLFKGNPAVRQGRKVRGLGRTGRDGSTVSLDLNCEALCACDQEGTK